MKSITCGSFSAAQVRPHEWEFTCKHLPDWREVRVCSEQDAMGLLFGLQARFRDTWEKAS